MTNASIVLLFVSVTATVPHVGERYDHQKKQFSLMLADESTQPSQPNPERSPTTEQPTDTQQEDLCLGPWPYCELYEPIIV